MLLKQNKKITFKQTFNVKISQIIVCSLFLKKKKKAQIDLLALSASTCKALILHLLRREILKQAWAGRSVPHHHSAPAVHLSRAAVPVVSVSRCRCPVRLVHRHSASHSFRIEGVTPQQSYRPPPPPTPSPTHAPRPRPACRMIARVREIRRLSDASRLGSLKNKSSCARLRRSLSFRRYPFPSHASSAKVLCVSPPLGPCAALVGAGVLNKSQHWSLFTAGAQYVSVGTNTKHGDALALSLSLSRSHTWTTEYFAGVDYIGCCSYPGFF